MNDYGNVIAPGTVRIERSLPGPIERLWEYLTDSQLRGAWLASGDMDLSPGGAVEMVFRNSELTNNDVPPPAKYAKYAGESRMSGRIIRCEPPHLLSFTWGEESEVRFELSPQGDRVNLVVTHSRIPDRDTMLSIAGGWHTHLDILRARLEGREPAGFWATHTRLESEYAQRIPTA
jgi:uncharacterized protein YndB with AHSA1/START domain